MNPSRYFGSGRSKERAVSDGRGGSLNPTELDSRRGWVLNFVFEGEQTRRCGWKVCDFLFERGLSKGVLLLAKWEVSSGFSMAALPGQNLSSPHASDLCNFTEMKSREIFFLLLQFKLPLHRYSPRFFQDFVHGRIFLPKISIENRFSRIGFWDRFYNPKGVLSFI